MVCGYDQAFLRLLKESNLGSKRVDMFLCSFFSIVPSALSRLPSQMPLFDPYLGNKRHWKKRWTWGRVYQKRNLSILIFWMMYG